LFVVGGEVKSVRCIGELVLFGCGLLVVELVVVVAVLSCRRARRAVVGSWKI
jgi:hypothetical protein